MFYSRTLSRHRKLKGRGIKEDDFVMIERGPVPIASQTQNEKKLVNVIGKKIKANSIINKKQSDQKKVQYIDMSPLLN